MNLPESARFAVRGVTANKMRSSLTTLGILIGVAAVIILVAVGTGSSAAIQDSISRLGSNTLTVNASQGGTGGRGGFGGGFGGPPGAAGGGSTTVSTGTQTRNALLTLDDATALTDKAQAPDVASVAPVVAVSSVTATYSGAKHTVSTFTGTTPSYLVNDNDSIQAGAAFSDADYTAHRRVAILGVTVAKDLVGGDGLAAVGKTVLAGGVGKMVDLARANLRNVRAL